MAFIVDIAVVILIITSIVSGAKKGFIKTLFGTLSLVIALVLAISFGKTAGAWIKGTENFKQVSESVDNYISDYFDNMLEDGALNANGNGDATAIDKLLSSFGVDSGELYDEYMGAMQSGAENAKQDFAVKVTNIILDCTATLFGTVLVFILSFIALKILQFILNGIFKLPVLNAANKVAGLILGIVTGILSALVLCTIISIIVPYIPENPVLYMGMENDTVIYKAVLRLNPLILFLFS